MHLPSIVHPPTFPILEEPIPAVVVDDHQCAQVPNFSASCVNRFTTLFLGDKWDNDYENRWIAQIELNPENNPC